jgi:hypothetical protein
MGKSTYPIFASYFAFIGDQYPKVSFKEFSSFRQHVQGKDKYRLA